MKFKILFYLIIFSLNVFAQSKPTIATPNAASIGLFGEIPVDYFNGLPSINIPLYEFKSKDLSIPISLSYHASNIKPSDHASWVGLGWTLQSGGVITRVMNDMPDEFILYDYVGNGANIGREKKGYFFNYGLLGSANWTGSILTDETNLRFVTNVISEPTYSNLLYRADKAPDEFQFNFLGMSGSMFMGQDGNWKLKTKQGLNFKVTLEMGSYRVVEPTSFPSIPAGSLVKNCINKITLIGSDGIQYTFGGTTTSIEFTRTGIGQPTSGSRDGGTVPSSWYLTNIKSVSGDEINLNYTRDGYQITNTPGGIAYEYYCPVCTPGASFSNGSGSTLGDNLSILDGVTLSSIIGANSSLQFDKAQAKILDYSINNPLAIPASTVQLFEAYGNEVFNGNISNGGYSIPFTKSTFMQLNNLIIKDNENTIIKSFTFNYNTGANNIQINNRLFLNSLVTKGSDGLPLAPYTFSYNNIGALAGVPYETNKVDHWGFYTGVDPLTGLVFAPNNILYGSVNFIFVNSGTSYFPDLFNPTFKTTYTNNRNTVEAAMKYAILTDVKYPTGGNTGFVWEPNTYSKYISQVPVGTVPNISVASAGGNLSAAGLRIKQINTQAGLNSPVFAKNYSYYQDYVNHTNYNSSGILNSAQPSYFDFYSSAGNFLYQVWANNNRATTHYTNGSPITYTKVQEVNSDGGFIVYTFSNHDNGYLDKQPAAGFFSGYGNTALQEFHTNSLELERGLLLERAIYNQNFALLSKINNIYNDDPNRYNINVRKFLFDNKFTLNGTIINWQLVGTGSNPFQSGAPAFLGANEYALNIYTFYPFLKSETTITYDQGGTNPLTIAKAFTYDIYRNRKTEAITSSKGEQNLASYSYSPDVISGLSAKAISGKSAMLNANITSFPLEKIVTRGVLQTERIQFNYQEYENVNKFISPLSSYKSVNGSPFESFVEYINFDSKGNIAEYIDRDGIPISYEFGYNQIYPVANVINAENTYKSVIVNTPGTATLSAGLTTGSGGAYATTNKTIVQTSLGSIVFVLSGSTPPAGVLLNVNYTLTGPSNRSGSLCYGGAGSTCVLPNASSIITFTAMPSGTYNLVATVTSSFTSFPVGVTFTYTHQSISTITNTSGIKEFFYQGFEELTGVATATPYSGKKYYQGDYTVPYTIPNAKTYKVNFHYLQAGLWSNITKTYTNSMILTEGDAIDEVRVYPEDAFMTTFTLNPLVGMTSQTDANGKTIFYEYDSFQRLSRIKDQDGNIIKQYDYQYQTYASSNSVWQSTGNLRCKPCLANIAYTTNMQQHQEKDINPQSTFYNTVKWVDDNIAGSCTIVPYWQNTTTTATCQKNTSNQNTGYQIQEQKDLNPCSSTFNNFRLNTTYNTSACPLPAPSVAITGQAGLSCSGTRTGSGTITASPGYLTTITISSGGSSGSYTYTVNISGGVTISRNVTNSSLSFTFIMAASGSVNWSSSISCPNNTGGGGMSVQ